MTRKLQLHPEILPEIGLVDAYWLELESIIDEFLGTLLKDNRPLEANVVTAGMRITERLNILLALVRFANLSNNIEARLKRAEKILRCGCQGEHSLQSERDQIVHAYWGLIAILLNIEVPDGIQYDLSSLSRASALSDRIKEISNEIEQCHELAKQIPMHHPLRKGRPKP